MKRIGIGVVGYGRIGAEHARWISQTIGGRVSCVADPTGQRRAKAQAAGLEVTETVRDLLARDDVDAVVVSSPTSMHFEHASAAIDAGKHVMVEKPVTLDLASAIRVERASVDRARVLSVFHNRRWDLDYLTARQAITSGVFGKIISIESRLGQWSSCVGPAAVEYRPNWRNEASFGGGGLYDWGAHLVDQIWQMMLPAKPVRVFAQLRGNVWTSDCDDFARVCIDFDSAAVAMVEINTTTTCPLPRWHIDGTAGSARSPFSLKFDTREWADFSFVGADGAARKLPPASAGLSQVQIWEQFCTACRGEGEPAVTISSVLPTMQILDAARESSRLGRVVELFSAKSSWHGNSNPRAGP